MKKSKRPLSPRISSRRRLSNLAIEPMEERMMLTASPGFVAGFATHSNGTVDTTATIQLLNSTGTSVVATTTPGSDGYYQFNNVTPGNYEVTEVEAGYTTSSATASTIVNPTTTINNGTAFAVTVVDPTTQTYTLSENAYPYNYQVVGYTLPNDPFNDAAGDQVGQLSLTVSGNLGNNSLDLGLCSDDYHGIAPGAVFSVNPSLTPVAPGITTNIGAIGYLYDHYGTALQGSVNGAALQLAEWSELYNSPASLNGPTFAINSIAPAAVVAQANAYLAEAAGKSEDAYFLNMTPTELLNVVGGQSMIGTDLLNFTNSPTGKVAGFVYVDSGNTGLRATGTAGGSTSPGVPNVTVVATTVVNGVTTIAGTTTTGTDGSYSFPSLAPGTYSISVVQPAGYLPGQDSVGGTVIPNSLGSTTIGSVVVTSGSTTSNVNFAELTPGTISGTVYNDATGNGLTATNAAPAGDTVEPGVTVKLTNSGGTVIATTTSASNGTYSFTGLTPGTYTVSEVTPTGQSQTGPGSVTYSATTTYGSTTPNENFSNYTLCNTASVSNIYYTVVTNGVSQTVTNLRGATSPGSVVTAYFTVAAGASDMITLAEYTAPAGSYSSSTASQQVLVGQQTGTFGPGSYSLTETNPNSFYQIDLVCGAAITSFNGGNVTYSSEGRLLGADNGGTTAYAADTLSGIVYLDYSANNTYNTNDTGVAGATVTLTGTSSLGVPVTATTTTGTNGTYSFTGIAPGTYKVVSLPPAYINENGGVGSGGGTASTGTVSSIVVNSNANLTNYNFGELFYGSISGTVYNDVTGNGLTSSGAAPTGDTTEAGVTVNLLNSAGTVVATTTTAANGTYSFGNLTPATYTVSEVAPTGQVQTGPAALTYSTTTSYGSTATDNFANMAPCVVTGVAGYYYGVTTNGVTTYVSNLRGATAPGSTVTAYIVFNPSGGTGTFTLAEYQAPAGYYDANTAYQQVLVGYQTATFTAPASSGYTTFSETVTNPNSYFQVDFACGQAITTLNGNVVNYNGENRLISADNGGSTAYVADTLSGTVFVDNNGNGSFGSGDTGLAGATVTLTGTSNLGAAVTATTTTAANGTYTFTGIAPGTYKVVSLPAGYINENASTGNGGVSGVGTVSSIVVNSNAVLTGYNFGNYKPVSISGTVFNDNNGNDTLDSGDTGLGGITVYLLNYTTGSYITTTTASNGAYSFTGIAPGSFNDGIWIPSGYVGELPNPGSAGGTAVLTGAENVFPFSVTSGTNATGYNFGQYIASTVSGTVYNDVNSNDKLDSGETGIAGITVTLSTSTGTVVATTTSAANGTYSFTGIAPGTYQVQEGSTPGYNRENANPGTSGGTPWWGAITGFSLTSGTNDTGNNFGQYIASTISGTVYNDVSGSGLTTANVPAANSGDTGEAGVTVNFLNASGTLVATTVTGSNGTYSATLPVGTYTVTETIPSGQYQTGPNSVTYTTTTSTASPNATGDNFANYMACNSAGLNNIQYFVNGKQVSGLGGNGAQGATVTITFNVAAGSAPIMLSLATYEAAYPYFTIYNVSQQVLVGDQTGTFGPGNHSLTVTLPKSYYQVDFVCGAPIVHFGPGGSNVDYGEEGRFISGDIGGVNAYSTSTLSGTVYNDATANGSFGSGDTGLAGTTVTLSGTTYVGANLVGTSLTPVAVSYTTTTDSNGNYSFAGLAPGTYTVTETTPSGYVTETASVGTAGGTAAVGSTTAIPLNSNTAATGYNFGQFKPASISGTVYYDKNFDDALDCSDVGIAGVNVYLETMSGAVVASTTTSSSGTYAFNGVTPGIYQVVESKPSGYTAENGNAGTAGGTAGAGSITAITLNSGVNATGYNLAQFKTASSCGYYCGWQGQWQIQNDCGWGYSTKLGTWLSQNCSTLCGSGCGSNNLCNQNNWTVANLCNQMQYQWGANSMQCQMLNAALDEYFGKC